MATKPVYESEPVGLLGPVSTLINTFGTVTPVSSGTQTTGALLLYTQNACPSGAANAAVVLPPSVPGLQVDVLNTNASNTMKVYPSAQGTGSEAINALGANAAITMSAATSTTFICIVAGQWWTSPRVPS